ncbi:hypothetical protein JXJ21_08295 [candidate division KSB1 bacterium]|nr:hypothetical protein [candidate division KSB1 bacterium]
MDSSITPHSGFQFRAGYACEKITPEPGSFGSFRLAPNKRSLGIHDTLWAQALFLSSGESRLMLLSLDVGMLEESTTNLIKSGICRAAGLLPQEITISATHTHNAAEVFCEEPGTRAIRQLEKVEARAVAAAESAFENQFIARLGWGAVECPGLAKNRFQDRIGGDIDKVDNRLDFLRIDDAAGSFKGLIWHFAAHPTTAMRAEYHSSADFCGEVNRYIRSTTGGFSMFFNGACGNINLELGERSFVNAAFFGKKIADSILAALPSTPTHEIVHLRSKQVEIQIPLTSKRSEIGLAGDIDEISAYFDDIEKQIIEPEAYDSAFSLYRRLRTSWWKHKLVQGYSEKEFETITIQAHRILDTLILTIPGELFIELQFELQQAMPGRRALIFGYSNGFIGYIPDPESFEIDTYETSPSYIHRAGKFAGMQMIRKGIEMFEDLI